MADSTVVPGQSFHVRSISMPSRSHPLVFKIEELMHKLKDSVVASSAKASSFTVENVSNDLKDLGELYRCIGELLHLPSTIQTFSSSNEKKWLENELEGSVRLLELCGLIKDMLVAIGERTQELQSAYRRRGDSASEDLIHSQIFSEKELRKSINNCQNLLKRVERICGSSPSTNCFLDLSMVARVLIEAREVTVSVIRSSLLLLSMSRHKASRWSFVSKAMNVRKVACNWEYESSRAVGSISFKDVESGLEYLFRRLIQNRVSLLNILGL